MKKSIDAFGFAVLGAAMACVVILLVFVVGTVLPNRERTQDNINSQTQAFMQKLESKGYQLNNVYFNSPSVTVMVDSFDALEEKAQSIGTTEIYTTNIDVWVADWSYKAIAFYVIDSQAAFAYKYVLPYTP